MWSSDEREYQKGKDRREETQKETTTQRRVNAQHTCPLLSPEKILVPRNCSLLCRNTLLFDTFSTPFPQKARFPTIHARLRPQKCSAPPTVFYRHHHIRSLLLILFAPRFAPPTPRISFPNPCTIRSSHAPSVKSAQETGVPTRALALSYFVNLVLIVLGGPASPPARPCAPRRTNGSPSTPPFGAGHVMPNARSPQIYIIIADPTSRIPFFCLATQKVASTRWSCSSWLALVPGVGLATPSACGHFRGIPFCSWVQPPGSKGYLRLSRNTPVEKFCCTAGPVAAVQTRSLPALRERAVAAKRHRFVAGGPFSRASPEPVTALGIPHFPGSSSPDRAPVSALAAMRRCWLAGQLRAPALPAAPPPPPARGVVGINCMARFFPPLPRYSCSRFSPPVPVSVPPAPAAPQCAEKERGGE